MALTTHTTQEPTGALPPRHVAPEPPVAPHADQPLLLQARGLVMPGREHNVFGPVDIDLPDGSLGVVTGQQGSGRSSLLLALAGRLQGVRGELVVDGLDGIAHPRALRKQTSVARITGLADLEPMLTVGESRDERAIADGLGQRRGRERFRLLEQVLGHTFALDDQIGRLPAVERTLLTVVLGALAPSTLVVLDDVDDSLTTVQLEFIGDVMAALAEADGTRFVVSALEADALPSDATVVALEPPATRPAPDVLPTSAIRRRVAAHREAR